MREFLLLFVFFLQPPKVEVLKKLEYQALIAEGYTILDVRTPEEFKEGHIQWAQNINIKDDNFITAIQKLSPSETLLVYCRSGRRSLYAAQVMVSFGFQKIYDLEGGFLNWKKE